MTSFSPREFRALLRRDFCSFVHRSFVEINPATPFSYNWHLDLMASKFTAVLEGKCRRLIVMVPPRSLKSITASVAFPAFVLGHKPSAQIVCASYNQQFAEKLARDTRKLMSSAFYRQLFPKSALPNEKPAAAEFTIPAGGSRFTTSPSGGLTGRGADIILVDDPLKPDEAMSETQRKAVNEWYDNTLFSRLNDKKTGAIVIIMQRLHEDDLVGHVLSKGEQWDVVRLPAIAFDEEVHDFVTPFGPRRIIRAAGDVLHPDREPRSVLDNIQATIGSYNFAGQYLQQPAPPGGGMIKREWFQTYPSHNTPGYDFIVQSWDTANTSNELADYSVCTVWGVKGPNVYLKFVYRAKLDFPELRKMVVKMRDSWLAEYVVIENKGSGQQLIQDLRYNGIPQVYKYDPVQDKIVRMHTQTPIIEAGRVFLPDQAPWLDAYLHEMTTFPSGRHDDQVDSTSQFLHWREKFFGSRVFRMPTNFMMR